MNTLKNEEPTFVGSKPSLTKMNYLFEALTGWIVWVCVYLFIKDYFDRDETEEFLRTRKPKALNKQTKSRLLKNFVRTLLAAVISDDSKYLGFLTNTTGFILADLVVILGEKELYKMMSAKEPIEWLIVSLKTMVHEVKPLRFSGCLDVLEIFGIDYSFMKTLVYVYSLGSIATITLTHPNSIVYFVRGTLILSVVMGLSS